MLADFFPDKPHLPFRHGLEKADKCGIAAFRAAYHVVFIGINALENRTQIVVGPYQSCFSRLHGLCRNLFPADRAVVISVID